MSDREWCTFELLPQAPDRKTKQWQVIGSGGDRDIIGYVEWLGSWRQYIFRSERAYLAVSCLLQISQFVGERNAEHSAELKARKVAP